jgi:LuxR family transcriptional regulator, maltose regulon positive regulatory protein
LTASPHGGIGEWLDPARPAGRDRLAVLETKLTPPFPRRGIVIRHGLVERLAAMDEPVVALMAPAGYGKSTLLSQWAHRAGRPVAWLSADDRDSDPATLLRGIAAAVDRAIGLDPSVIDSVAIPGPSVWSTAVPRLGAAVAASAPMTLVIDDVDRIGSRDALDVVVTLAGYLGADSRMGVAGRRTGEFPVARLTSQGQLASLESDALALDLVETQAIVRAAGADLTSDEVLVLHERTEGWPAGVYLSALAARGGGRPVDARLTANAAAEGLVEEYIRSEVLATMTPGDAELLLHASVLDRVSGPLCDELLGRSGTAVALERLARANLFLIPLDRDRTWFRFHHLLAELLRAELARQEPGAAADLRGRAAAWHEARGMVEPALEYALAAEDEPRAARLLAGLGQGAVNAGRNETVRRWFGWFEGRGAWSSHPRLAAQAAMAFALDGDMERSRRWSEHTRDGGDADDGAGINAVARSFLCQDGVDRMHADASFATARLADDDPYMIAALGLLGIATILRGDADGGEAHLVACVARWERSGGANYSAALALTHLAGGAMARGDWGQAGTHAHRARSIALANGLDEQAAAAAADAVEARVAVHHGATEQARADATHARRLRTLLTPAVPWLAIRVRLDLIRVDLALGDGGGARTLLAEVREIIDRRPDMGSLVAETAELERRVGAVRGGVAGATTLTLAELRLLPLLTTHLSFREIGERLYVSQNTVKTQAISIYRKLEATSRSEAVERAIEIGLLDGTADEGRPPLA